MKKQLFIFVAVAANIFLYSCCKKGPLQVPNLRINYPILEMQTHFIHAVHYTNDSIVDFEAYIYEDEAVGYEFPVYTSSKISKQIVDVYAPASDSSTGMLLYTDTISNINLEYGGRCQLEIEEFWYVHNGTTKTDNKIVK